MAADSVEVAIVGGGAAGIAAGRRLADAGIDCLIVEARPRLGGRALTATDLAPFPIDLGCGWLHSAKTNPWGPIAEKQGRAIDRSIPAPWMRPLIPIGFPLAEQEDYRKSLIAYRERTDDFPEEGPDVAAETFLEPGNRWNPLIDAVSTFYSGAELRRVSTRDLARYDDSGVNWRVVEGYGSVIVAHAAGVPVTLDCAVRCIDHGGTRIRLETAKGVISADRVIVTLPSNVLAEEAALFTPALPAKTEAAAGLPLGLADKLFLTLSDAEAFEPDTRLFGHKDRRETAAYHFRPFGRPLIEAYFGGAFAASLERGGDKAFLDFALGELTGLLGDDFARKVRPLPMHAWGTDPFARGSYSFALPGKADCRALLAEPVDDRIFFAGEACSRNDYSTAHGAYWTGVAAAEQVIAAGRRHASG